MFKNWKHYSSWYWKSSFYLKQEHFKTIGNKIQSHFNRKDRNANERTSGYKLHSALFGHTENMLHVKSEFWNSHANKTLFHNRLSVQSTMQIWWFLLRHGNSNSSSHQFRNWSSYRQIHLDRLVKIKEPILRLNNWSYLFISTAIIWAKV